MRVLVLLGAIISGTTAFGASAREVYYQGQLTPYNIGPTYDKGYVIVYDTGVTVYAPDGALAYHAQPHVPRARASILNAGVSAEGTLVAAIEYDRNDRHGARGGIAIYDRSGSPTRFFDTGEYLPAYVSLDSDHAIWVLGWRWPRTVSEEDYTRDDYFMLRKYSLTGTELGAFLPRSSVAPGPDPISPCVGCSQLRVENGHVGALLFATVSLRPGQKPRTTMLWIETDLTGKELSRVDVPGPAHALIRSGALYKRQGKDVAVFDRLGNSWRPVMEMSDGWLVGADEENLVFQIKSRDTLRMVPVSAK